MADGWMMMMMMMMIKGMQGWRPSLFIGMGDWVSTFRKSPRCWEVSNPLNFGACFSDGMTQIDREIRSQTLLRRTEVMKREGAGLYDGLENLIPPRTFIING